MLTRIRGTLSIPFEATIAHLTEGGESVYVEAMCAEPDSIEADQSAAEVQRWHAEAYRLQRSLQEEILADPTALKRLLRHMLIGALEDLEVEPLDDILRLPANAINAAQFFCPDLFSQGFETAERAHQVLDQIGLDLGNPSVKLAKARELTTGIADDLLSVLEPD